MRAKLMRFTNTVFHRVFQVKIQRHNGQWWAMKTGRQTYGECIYNPNTDNGGFPGLTTLLKWCIKHRS